ncbi:hypothetical protein [Marinoscillum sp.]|uniref:hypothetical protein n=1 Tax=Marinoscillum sp. TaxID=2024838 RepID=UPI003BACF993
MTIAELKEVIDEDSTFADTYKYIQYTNDSILKSEFDKVKWLDLTYERLHNYTIFSKDTSYFNPIFERLKAEWDTLYAPYLDQVDSLSKYWAKYEYENSIDRYVLIEPAEIYKERYSYSNNVKSVSIGFRLTPLKGRIDQIRFGYRILSKLQEDDNESALSSLLSSYDMTWCRASSPLSKPDILYWETNYTNEKLLKYISFRELIRDYDIVIKIDEIRVNGVNLSDDDLKIPKSIKNYWKYEYHETLHGLYADEVLSECLGIDFLELYEYRWQELNKILKKYDKLSSEFFQLKNPKI